jgi:hypothetical protein
MMPAWLTGAIRTGLQALWGIGAAWLIAHHVPVPAEVPAPVQLVVLSLIAAAAAGVIQWAERRAGGPGAAGKLGTLVRWLARIIMLGTRVARYPAPESESVKLLRAQQARRRPYETPPAGAVPPRL